MKHLTIILIISTFSNMLVAQSSASSFDAYVNSPNDNVFTEIISGTKGINKPNDLDFNTNETNGKNELWVINEGTENSGGSTVTIINAGESNQASTFKQDGNAWHFMSLPTAMAFGNNGAWANSTGVLSANHNGSLFTGPSLWSGDLLVYAITPPGGNGSHLDMLHQSPYSMGIAHEKDNIYWVNDGYHQSIVMYDFAVDHGPGNSWHDDGRVHYYPEINVKRDPTGVPSHLVLDKTSDWLYLCDAGNKRIMRMKVGSASKKQDLPFNLEVLAERWEMENVTSEMIANSGLSKPCGIDVFGDRLIVTDNGTNEIIIYDLTSSAFAEVGRISMPHSNPNIRGIKVDFKGRIWFVDYNNNKVFMIDNQAVVGIQEQKNELSMKIYPNPAKEAISIDGLEDANVSSIMITDSQGRTVNNRAIDNLNGSITIDISTLNSGIYFALISTESGQVVTEKFIKE